MSASKRVIEMFTGVKLPRSPGSRWRSAIGAGVAIDAIEFADDDTAALGEKSCRIGWSTILSFAGQRCQSERHLEWLSSDGVTCLRLSP
jgi:hypothetical protein